MARLVLTLGSFGLLLLDLPRPAAAIESVAVVRKSDFPEAKQPQVAVGPKGKILVVFGSGNSIFCTASDDGGKSYRPASKVGDVGALSLGMRRGPRIAVTEKAVLVTAVGGEQGHGRDGDLFAWRSEDGGKTWKGPVRVNTVDGSAREGLHHLAAALDGTFYCVWLDLRAKKTELYGASSADGGGRWQNEKRVYRSPDGSVCQCCQPQVAYSPEGVLHVMWRNQLSGNRDMYLINSKDNGRTFDWAAKLGRGTWPLDACPMDGGGLACGAGGEVLTIWRRDKQIFRCAAGQPETSLGEGAQGWAAAGADGIFLAWISRRPGPVMVLPPNADEPSQLADRGSDPVVAGPISGKGPVIAAWECGDSNGSDRIRAAVLDRGN